jgi:hypothetical protein
VVGASIFGSCVGLVVIEAMEMRRLNAQLRQHRQTPDTIHHVTTDLPVKTAAQK